MEMTIQGNPQILEEVQARVRDGITANLQSWITFAPREVQAMLPTAATSHSSHDPGSARPFVDDRGHHISCHCGHSLFVKYPLKGRRCSRCLSLIPNSGTTIICGNSHAFCWACHSALEGAHHSRIARKETEAFLLANP